MELTAKRAKIATVVAGLVIQAESRESASELDLAQSGSTRMELFELFIGHTTEKSVKTLYSAIQDAVCTERGKPSNQVHCGGLKNRKPELQAIVNHKYATFEYVHACLVNGISWAAIERSMRGIADEVVGDAVDKVLSAMDPIASTDIEEPPVSEDITVHTIDWEKIAKESQAECTAIREELADVITAITDLDTLDAVREYVA